MAISLSNLVNNLAERLHEINCKYKHDHKNMKGVELNIILCNIDYESCLDRYTSATDDLI